MNLESIQSEIQKTGLDGWLFFDHHERDPLAYRVLGLKPPGHVSRRWYDFIPARGEPRGLVHQVEPHVLNPLPGARIPYARWQEQEAGLRTLLQDAKKAAMQYSPRCAVPYVANVDAGRVELIREKEMAARRKRRMEKGATAMRDHMWDEAAGTFLSVKRDFIEKIPVATIGSWIPLAAGVPTEVMARRMAAGLASPAWMTPLPVSTVDRTDKRWKSNAFWRGDVWPPTNFPLPNGWSTTSTGAPMSLSDTNTAGQPQRFYRLEAANP